MHLNIKKLFAHLMGWDLKNLTFQDVEVTARNIMDKARRLGVDIEDIDEGMIVDEFVTVENRVVCYNLNHTDPDRPNVVMVSINEGNYRYTAIGIGNSNDGTVKLVSCRDPFDQINITNWWRNLIRERNHISVDRVKHMIAIPFVIFMEEHLQSIVRVYVRADAIKPGYVMACINSDSGFEVTGFLYLDPSIPYIKVELNDNRFPDDEEDDCGALVINATEVQDGHAIADYQCIDSMLCTNEEDILEFRKTNDQIIAFDKALSQSDEWVDLLAGVNNRVCSFVVVDDQINLGSVLLCHGELIESDITEQHPIVGIRPITLSSSHLACITATDYTKQRLSTGGDK